MSDVLDELVSSRIVTPAVADSVRLLHDTAGIAMAKHPAWCMALALVAGSEGHSCLDLDDLGRWADDLGPERLLDAGVDLRKELSSTGRLVAAVVDGAVDSRTPFVLDGSRLYVARAWHEECAVAAAVTRPAGKVKVLLGGPGSGKTTRVATELLTRFSGTTGETPRVALAAPTGKAARRMREAVDTALARAKADRATRERILASVTTSTVHRLLGYSPNRSPRHRFNDGNTLPFDWVVVDEASMMSLSLMHRLLDAVDPDTEIWLVGDPNQLASVDAGTVLDDIAAAHEAGRESLADIVEVLDPNPMGGGIPPRFVDIPTTYEVIAGVRGLKDPDRPGNIEVPAILSKLQARNGELEWIDPARHHEDYVRILATIEENAREVARLALLGDAAAALDENSRLQVLCAHREGRLGVSGFNARVRVVVDASRAEFYVGRPVMVVRNDESLELANGDIGVVCRDSRAADGGTGLVAAFPGGDGPRIMAVSRLPEVETVHALTIHKSQGSEYEHVVVVLPERQSPVLTRELLYTGISRPTRRLTIVAAEDVLRRTLETSVRRATGLAGRF